MDGGVSCGDAWMWRYPCFGVVSDSCAYFFLVGFHDDEWLSGGGGGDVCNGGGSQTHGARPDGNCMVPCSYNKCKNYDLMS